MWSEFPRSFLEKELRQHKEQIIFDRERARLPETQNEIFEEKQLNVYNVLARAHNAMITHGSKDEIATLRKMVTDVRLRLGLNDDAPIVYDQGLRKKKAVQWQAICPCPSRDCRGFIEKKSYTCGICNLSVCSKCRVEKKEGHECKDDDVATVQALIRDTKPCPSCGTPIFKIDGCDQIWTPCCKKAFSWSTGEFETKIHSPEYYDYCRRMGITIGRAQDPEPVCNNGYLPQFPIFLRTFEANHIHSQQIETMTMIHCGILHSQVLGQTTYHELLPLTNENKLYATLRKQYILHEITEEAWRRRLIAEERKRERRTALSNIYNVCMRVSMDLMNEMVVQCTQNVVDTNLIALENLRLYVNDCFLGVSRRYKTVPYVINSRFRIVRSSV